MTNSENSQVDYKSELTKAKKVIEELEKQKGVNEIVTNDLQKSITSLQNDVSNAKQPDQELIVKNKELQAELDRIALEVKEKIVSGYKPNTVKYVPQKRVFPKLDE